MNLRYRQMLDQILSLVAGMNETGRQLYCYPLENDKVILFLMLEEQLEQYQKSAMKLRDVGFYVGVKPTESEGYDPTTHPLEVEYTHGSEDVGTPIIVGTYADEAVDIIASYIYRYLTTGMTPNLPASSIQ